MGRTGDLQTSFARSASKGKQVGEEEKRLAHGVSSWNSSRATLSSYLLKKLFFGRRPPRAPQTQVHQGAGEAPALTDRVLGPNLAPWLLATRLRGVAETL